ncbi:uncharacterized protein LOC113356051 isoform X3 [Papaver somniferum]|uniref:uncharacterized protein LOC113356051 isoform X3 n=1 Tax=Papaver somniferum TaxID=3469 RepID=UPI000E705712|nr:uncharacterized protein LOC113356051 isoform X3 [Papaver somniferum]
MKLSLLYRVKATAALEIESVYQQYCQQYVRTLDKGEEADRIFAQRRPLVMVRREEVSTTLSYKRWNKRATQKHANQQVNLVLKNKSGYDINN